VIGILSGTVAASARSLGHYISFGVTCSLMIALNCYIFYCAIKKRKNKPHYIKFGPFYLTFLAALFILADLARHVLQDVNIWKSGPWPGSSEYRDGCPTETIKCLSVVGVIFTIIFTYTGFILLFCGTMWNSNIISKLKGIKEQWNLLRKKV